MKIRPAAIIIAYLSALLSLALYVQECRGDENCKYNVSEIDSLRSALEYRYLFGTACLEKLTGGSSRSYKESEKDQAVEIQLRTYMQACIKARDIINEDCREE